jgi:hypothetical protein
MITRGALGARVLSLRAMPFESVSSLTETKGRGPSTASEVARCGRSTWRGSGAAESCGGSPRVRLGNSPGDPRAMANAGWVVQRRPGGRPGRIFRRGTPAETNAKGTTKCHGPQPAAAVIGRERRCVRKPAGKPPPGIAHPVDVTAGQTATIPERGRRGVLNPRQWHRRRNADSPAASEVRAPTSPIPEERGSWKAGNSCGWAPRNPTAINGTRSCSLWRRPTLLSRRLTAYERPSHPLTSPPTPVSGFAPVAFLRVATAGALSSSASADLLLDSAALVFLPEGFLCPFGAFSF